MIAVSLVFIIPSEMFYSCFYLFFYVMFILISSKFKCSTSDIYQ